MKIYATRLSGYTFGATGTNAGYPLTNLATYLEHLQWRGANNNNSQVLTIDLGAATEIDSLVIAKSNHGNMETVVVEAADNSAFSTNLVTPIANLVIEMSQASSTTQDVYHFNAVTKRYWRLRYADTGGNVPQVGQVFLCKRLTFQYPYEFGYSKSPEFQTSRSTALDGTLRGSAAIGGRKVLELPFKLWSDTFRDEYIAFERTVIGGLIPFYVLDINGTTIHYVVLAEDYTPIRGTMYNQNEIGVLKMLAQQADVL